MVIHCTDDELEAGFVHAMCTFGMPLHRETLRTLFNKILLSLEQGGKFSCVAARSIRTYGFRGGSFRRYMSTLGVMGSYRKAHPPLILISDHGPMDEAEIAGIYQSFNLPRNCTPLELGNDSYFTGVA